MEWKVAAKNDQGLYKIPNRWLHIHYYEALNILFRFENSLRIFVYAVLKNEFRAGWKNCSFTPSNGAAVSIKALAAKRIVHAENFGYLGFGISSPLMHLTSGELIELFTSDAYWPKFRPYFKGNKEIIKNKLLEIGTIRNSLAHFRPIKLEDIELIKQNCRHTLFEVESCLQNMFQHHLRVPTNTQADWYKSINTLGTDQITTTPFYSSDESWVTITLKFKTPILKKDKLGEHFYTYSLAKANTANILVHHLELASFVTYASEKVHYPDLLDNFEIRIDKDINLVFRKDVLETNHGTIAEELRSVLRKISEECDLLLQDNLARGEIIEPVRGHTYWYEPEGKDGRWQHSFHGLWQTYQPDHPDEYWGKDDFSDDVVAGFNRYPWMPEEISDEDSLW